MSDPRHIVCLTFDFDTVALWIAMGQTSPTAISRGEFGVVGAARLLKLMRRLAIPSTWFIPGLTADTYPDACREVADHGHEIGHHGYDHVSPVGLDRVAELEQLTRGSDALERATGQRPVGYRSPAWDLSANSIELLVENEFVYDSSMMGHDYLPYYARVRDVIEAGRRVRFGEPSSLIEMPISWSVDDFPHFEFFRGGGLRAAEDVFDNWLADYQYMVDEYRWGIFTITCHPFVIGRGHRMRMLEKLLVELQQRGAVFVTMHEAAAEFLDRGATAPDE